MRHPVRVQEQTSFLVEKSHTDPLSEAACALPLYVIFGSRIIGSCSSPHVAETLNVLGGNQLRVDLINGGEGPLLALEEVRLGVIGVVEIRERQKVLLLYAALETTHQYNKYMEQSALKFVPSQAQVDIGFWTTLSKKKIEEYKLDDNPVQIVGKLKSNNFKNFVSYDVYSFSQPEYNKSGPYEVYLSTTLQNFNMVETYQKVDVIEYLSQHPDIVSANLFMFADLKKYIFRYRFAVPQVQLNGLVVNEKKGLSTVLGDKVPQFFDSLKKIVQDSTLELNQNKPYTFINADFASISLEQAKSTTDSYVLYFDSFSSDGVSGTFQNLLLYLKNQGFTSTRVIVFKDFLSYGGQKVELKGSFYVSVDLSGVTVSDTAFGLQHYAQEKEIDLKGFMDEKMQTLQLTIRLARDAVDLNIKLMKWRMLPNVDLELIKGTKCLLFGSGTLGCQLARNLIGWGVRHITFIDYGKVSYSNPVRQTLFDFSDSCQGGRPKAEVAAERLKLIFPDIVSEGYQLEIPMPGHYVGEAQGERVVDTINKLDTLVAEHDAVFLLTDSREARWFPTLLANKHNKICFAVALGFDSFMVLRHGKSVTAHDPQVHGERLSCYFCNDISAPGNSMKDRTLDQQCTVTRPGLSFLAAAYSSELLVSLLQHPLREGAPASDQLDRLEQTDLGVLPHFLRGQLSDFEVKIFYGRAYDKLQYIILNRCVACSQNVLDEYLKDKEQFILRVMNEPDYLQTASGIAETLNQYAEMREIEIVDDFAIIQ